MAALFPEVPSRDFQAIDTTLDSTDAASLMSGSTSTATSRPSTAAASRPLSGLSERVVNAANLKKALSESFSVSAADCLHACHAHLTDPENFWKSINDACAIRCAACTEHALAPPWRLLTTLQVCNLRQEARSRVRAGPPSWMAQHIQPDALRWLLPA
jgi:hypothetical protein